MKTRNITKLLATLIALLMLATAILPMTAMAASAPETYVWTFEDASLNDETNHVYTANGKNNKLTWHESSTLTNYTADQKFVGVKAAETAELGQALYACGGYFTLDETIKLDGKKAWKVTLTGRIPTSLNSNAVNSKTTLFAPSADSSVVQGFALSINANFCRYKGTFMTSTVNDPTWKSGTPRLGQHNTQTLTMWNEYNEADGHWYIHWTVYCYNNTGAAWGNLEYVSSTPTDEFSLDINTLGTEAEPFSFNAGGSGPTYYMHHFSNIEICPDVNAVVEDSPVTGDNSALFVMIAAVAVVGLGVTAVSRKRSIKF